MAENLGPISIGNFLSYTSTSPTIGALNVPTKRHSPIDIPNKTLKANVRSHGESAQRKQ